MFDSGLARGGSKSLSSNFESAYVFCIWSCSMGFDASSSCAAVFAAIAACSKASEPSETEVVGRPVAMLT